MDGRRRNRAAKEHSLGSLDPSFSSSSHSNNRHDDFGSWSCSMCTYVNVREAFKCQICDTRKGTSTRKPRVNNLVVEQQQLIEKTIINQQYPDDYLISIGALNDTTSPPTTAASLPPNGVNVKSSNFHKINKASKRSSTSSSHHIIDDENQFFLPPKLKNIDRHYQNGRMVDVCYKGVTITIKELFINSSFPVLPVPLISTPTTTDTVTATHIIDPSSSSSSASSTASSSKPSHPPPPQPTTASSASTACVVVDIGCGDGASSTLSPLMSSSRLTNNTKDDVTPPMGSAGSDATVPMCYSSS